MKLEMTIQAGEGGKDARLLVVNQAKIYETYAQAHGIRVQKENSALG